MANPLHKSRFAQVHHQPGNHGSSRAVEEKNFSHCHSPIGTTQPSTDCPHRYFFFRRKVQRRRRLPSVNRGGAHACPLKSRICSLRLSKPSAPLSRPVFGI